MPAMKIKFYGKLADIVGRDLDLAIVGHCTIGELRERLSEAYPAIASPLQDKRVRAFIGSVIATDERQIRSHDEVEFLAPVSGG